MDRRARIALSAFYFANFAAVGLFVPYFNIYARSLGFSATQIGLLLALVPLAKAGLPSVWGAAADRTGRRRTVLAFAAWASAAAFSGFLFVESFTACLLVMALYAALAVPVLPFVEATTLEKTDRGDVQYGRVRVFGSLGFAVAALLYGQVAVASAPGRVIVVHLALLIAAAVAAGQVPVAPRRPEPRETVRGQQVLVRLPLLLVLAAGFLMQASHGAYIGFFSLVLKDAGYAESAIGVAWAGSIAAEVAVLFVAGSLVQALGSRRLLALSVAAAMLRWGLYATSVHPLALWVGQPLHGLTYAGFHVAAIGLVHRLTPAGARSTGQAFYSGWTYGAGLMVGTSLAGWVYDRLGDAWMFAASALLAGGALVLIALGAGRPRHAAQAGTAPDPILADGRR